MESTGDAHRHERTALLAALTLLAWALVYIAASGAIRDTDSGLPSCSDGNYLAATCKPDESGEH